MIIYVDAGNTTVKFYHRNCGQWRLLWRQPTANLWPIAHFWRLLTRQFPSSPSQRLELWVCSVVPDWTVYLQRLASQYSHVKVQLLLSSAPPRTVKFARNLNPLHIGADLLALSCFASQWENTIVVCLGTATTAVVVKNHMVVGYIISPGWQLSYQNLVEKAQLLRLQPHTITAEGLPQQLIGTNTPAAMMVGAVMVPWLGIKSWVQAVRSIHNKTARWKLVLTGGDASLVASLVGSDQWDYQPFAVVMGLRRWLQGTTI